MIRVLIFLLLVGALALGVAWFADRPGEVVITWLNWRVETSLMVLAVAVVIAAALAMLAWALVRGVVRVPENLSLFMRHRRSAHGYLAISRGLIAVGAGDLRAARKFAGEARRLAPSEPLALLLNAQTAQLAGDRTAAEKSFGDMAGRPDTKALGLHGLYVEAQRRDDLVAARAYAEEAARSAPSAAWAGRAVLEFRCAAGDWAGALMMLESNMKAGALDRDSYRRQRAALLTAQALATEDSDRDSAKAAAIEAAKLAPAFVPAVALAARLLGEGGEVRKGSRMIERAWLVNPHPDLAETYAGLRVGDTARDRLARVENLALKTPGDPEGELAVARAALDAREFARARAALAPLVAEPTQRVALLMAELEEKEHGEEGRAREWMARAVHARRDPAWTADGFVSDRWMPVSPVSGRLDAFQWRVPLAELAVERPAIEVAAPAPVPDATVIDVSPVTAAPAAAGGARKEETSARAAPAPPPSRRWPKRMKDAAGAALRVQPVIPLVRAPDDPGPEREGEPDAAAAAASRPEGWWRGLFK
jgi:HemY protein